MKMEAVKAAIEELTMDEGGKERPAKEKAEKTKSKALARGEQAKKTKAAAERWRNFGMI